MRLLEDDEVDRLKVYVEQSIQPKSTNMSNRYSTRESGCDSPFFDIESKKGDAALRMPLMRIPLSCRGATSPRGNSTGRIKIVGNSVKGLTFPPEADPPSEEKQKGRTLQ